MSSKNPSRDGSLEPPDLKTHVTASEDNAERGAGLRSRKGAANPGFTSSRTAELAKRFKALKKEYIAGQREKAVAILAANKAAFESYLPRHTQAAEAKARKTLPIPKFGDLQTDTPGSLGPHGAAPALPSNVLPLPLSDRRVSVKPVGSGALMRSYVRPIPAVQPPPSYTMWSYLKRNELARDHGRRMFLVDEVGETVPADDGETEERLPWEDVDGAAVDWAMVRLAQEYGWRDPDVLEALMEAFRSRPQPEVIAQRLAYLERARLVDEDRQDMEVEEVIDTFVGSFCRRCRIYGCRTHSGGHVKPHQRPAPPKPDTSAEPCGPGCWRHAAGAAAAAASSGGGGGARPRGLGNESTLGGAAAAAAPPPEASQAQDRAAGGAHQPPAAQGRDRSGAATERGDGDAMDIDGDKSAGAGAGPSGRQQRPLAVSGAGPGGEGRGGGDAAEGGSSGRPAWSRYELSVVKQGLQVFGLGNPCMAAALLFGSRTCAEVKEALERIDREQRAAPTQAAAAASAAAATSAAAAAAAASAAAGPAAAGGGSLWNGLATSDGAGGGTGDYLEGLSRVPARRKGGRMKKAVLTNSKNARSLVVSARAQHGNNDWHEYQPCTCMGKCKADCPCVQAHNFCEKFCACSTACRERFRGCTCKSGCKNNQCPCWAAGRECDPDLCGGCAPTLEARAEPGRECNNMRLRMRQHAHVVLGTSDIPGAGWGLFAAQYVAKNGFLGEYTGDLITQDEANRRGSVYDHMNNSYLFNLNNEWVVDAKFRGNKLRCANHSHEPVAKAKVLLVDGESRIAILADKNVTPGMEITYDYRYSDDTAPQWVKKKQRG